MVEFIERMGVKSELKRTVNKHIKPLIIKIKNKKGINYKHKKIPEWIQCVVTC